MNIVSDSNSPIDRAFIVGYEAGMRRAAEIAYEAWLDGVPPAEIKQIILNSMDIANINVGYFP